MLLCFFSSNKLLLILRRYSLKLNFFILVTNEIFVILIKRKSWQNIQFDLFIYFTLCKGAGCQLECEDLMGMNSKEMCFGSAEVFCYISASTLEIFLLKVFFFKWYFAVNEILWLWPFPRDLSRCVSTRLFIPGWSWICCFWVNDKSHYFTMKVF